MLLTIAGLLTVLVSSYTPGCKQEIEKLCPNFFPPHPADR